MKKDYLKYVKTGDKLWSFVYGWGEVTEVHENRTFPITVEFTINKKHSTYKNYEVYDFSGKVNSHANPSLFFDELKMPERLFKKPLPKLDVDAKVIVWNFNEKKKNRYFSHFDEDGEIYCFPNGSTSWSKVLKHQAIAWNHYEILKD